MLESPFPPQVLSLIRFQRQPANRLSQRIPLR